MGGIKLFGKKLTTFQIIIICFAGFILLGTLVLMLPVSTAGEKSATFGDALFTATSAVCVTGLVVRDTATYWSSFGQAAILLMIQVGGLGIISVAAVMTVISGKRISLAQRSVMQDAMSAPQLGGIVRMTLSIVRAAFIFEFIGAAAMAPVFCKYYGAAGIWMAIFHSISAFCNAGFDIMGAKSGEFSSLTSMSGEPVIIAVICILIVVGGIGFLTWDDVVTNGIHFKRYRMQSKVIIITSLSLIMVPAVLMFFTDFSKLPIGERISASLFQAITPRTAGFNTVDVGAMTGGGKFLIVFLMMIGGSPGSTAGGTKTTTFAVLIANAASVFGRKKSASIFGRRIEDAIVKTATAIFTGYILLSLFGAFVISTVEGLPFGDCIFETVSAICTVGLTQGITPMLGTVSRIIIIFLMFTGRVGGLTLVYAAIFKAGVDSKQLPVEKITVG